MCLWQWKECNEETTEGSTNISEPQLLASFNHPYGDVNEIQWLTEDLCAVASSNGDVCLLRIDRENLLVNRDSTGYKLMPVNKWNQLHCSSNSLTTKQDHIITVGSEGKMCLLNFKKQTPVRIYKSADSGSMSSVIFMKQEEVATANNRGEVKIWDLRSNEEKPNKICHLAMDLGNFFFEYNVQIIKLCTRAYQVLLILIETFYIFSGHYKYF